MTKEPIFLPAEGVYHFPDPTSFDDEGLVAVGGNLSAEQLLVAYCQGVFPWFDAEPMLWWSPHPRAVIDAGSLHLSRSLRRAIARTELRLSCNEDFEGVMRACADRPEGTWITEEMILAYGALHQAGYARSYEVWQGAELVGGLYGVRIFGVFCAESKFHRVTDASKMALALAVLHQPELESFDVQFRTDHLASLGVHEIPREEYLRRLRLGLRGEAAPKEQESDLLPFLQGKLAK